MARICRSERLCSLHGTPVVREGRGLRQVMNDDVLMRVWEREQARLCWRLHAGLRLHVGALKVGESNGSWSQGNWHPRVCGRSARLRYGRIGGRDAQVPWASRGICRVNQWRAMQVCVCVCVWTRVRRWSVDIVGGMACSPKRQPEMARGRAQGGM